MLLKHLEGRVKHDGSCLKRDTSVSKLLSGWNSASSPAGVLVTSTASDWMFSHIQTHLTSSRCCTSWPGSAAVERKRLKITLICLHDPNFAVKSVAHNLLLSDRWLWLFLQTSAGASRVCLWSNLYTSLWSKCKNNFYISKIFWGICICHLSHRCTALCFDQSNHLNIILRRYINANTGLQTNIWEQWQKPKLLMFCINAFCY